jgi:pimeloyl-ACP methyl ester carboxylesterase
MAIAFNIEPVARTAPVAGRGPGVMAFQDFGPKSRPVDAVFLHANGFNALTYRHILAPLAAQYRILAVDQRGHGDTTLQTIVAGRNTWLDLRDDLIAFLTALDLSKIVLAGHSMGATVSLLAAARQPALCRRLALFDPVVLSPARSHGAEESPMVQAARRRRAVFPNRAAATKSYRGRGAFKSWPEAILADYVAAGFHELPRGEVTLACAPEWEASGYASQGHDTLGAFRSASCTIDILRAEIDSTFQIDAMAEMVGDHVDITTVPGTTHFLPMERPELVRSTLSKAMDAATSDNSNVHARAMR